MIYVLCLYEYYLPSGVYDIRSNICASEVSPHDSIREGGRRGERPGVFAQAPSRAAMCSHALREV